MSRRQIKKSPGADPRKRPGWEARLRELMFGLMGTTLTWSRADCHTVVLRAIDAMAGTDLYSILRGRYDDEEGAIAVRDELGDVLEHLEALGFYETPEARFGDIAIYSGVRQVGTWPGSVPAVCMSSGLVMLPIGRRRVFQLAPLRAAGELLKVIRVPCLPR